MATLKQPQILGTLPVGGKWVIPGRTVNSQIARSTIQDTQCNINHAAIKGYEKARMQNERNRGHWIQDGGNPSQPGGPSKEGPADFHIFTEFFPISSKMTFQMSCWRTFMRKRKIETILIRSAMKCEYG